MSRPPVEIDMKQLALLMRFKPTREDCAAFFKCSHDTIERRIREFTQSEEHPEGLSFVEFREQGLVQTKVKLFNEAMARSAKSDAVLIFLLKNFCGMTDKQQIDAAVIGRSIDPHMPDEVVEARFRELMAKLGPAIGGGK